MTMSANNSANNFRDVNACKTDGKDSKGSKNLLPSDKVRSVLVKRTGKDRSRLRHAP